LLVCLQLPLVQVDVQIVFKVFIRAKRAQLTALLANLANLLLPFSKAHAISVKLADMVLIQVCPIVKTVQQIKCQQNNLLLVFVKVDISVLKILLVSSPNPIVSNVIWAQNAMVPD